ncbi:MAG: SlyX family protein [Pseudomonadota bacterium]
MSDRATELETRVAFQDKTIQELNDVVTRQQGEIDRLVRDMEALKVQVRSLSSYPVASRDDETPPPHY